MTNISLLIARWYHVTVVYRVVVDVIYVTLIITLAAAEVFPKNAAAKCLVLPSSPRVAQAFQPVQAQVKPGATENSPWRVTPYDF